VVLTMVDGAVVARGGRVTSVDETALLDEAREVFAAKQAAVKTGHGAADQVLPVYRDVVRRAASVDVGFTRWVNGT
jgi:5-methylthioadenosine/S-adenosylhomocysteine deaminase